VYPFGDRPAGDHLSHAAPEGLVEAEDPDDAFHRWLRAGGGNKGSVVVLRPDRFVFALVHAAQMPETTRELARQLHRAEAAPENAPCPVGAPALMEAA
jgi:3-(3-hydroxy-phenyl)propionate hydroxylase